MRKTLSELIAEKHAGKEPNRAARNRAAFVANLLEIKQAFEDGWSGKIIWETLTEQKEIDFSYRTFCRYVKRMIVNTPRNNNSPQTGGTSSKAKSGGPKIGRGDGPIVASAEIATYKHNPMPNEEELY